MGVRVYLIKSCRENDIEASGGSCRPALRRARWLLECTRVVPVDGPNRCFNDDHGDITWIPLDLAAKALAAFRQAPSSVPVVHLVHPRAVSWHSLAAPIAQKLSVSLVPYNDWLTHSEGVAQSVRTVHGEPGLLLEPHRTAITVNFPRARIEIYSQQACIKGA